jgi:hypothetical protein
MTVPTTGPIPGPSPGPAMSDRIAESRRRHAEALEMGGEQAVDRHRASGRLPVRERIALIADEGSWFETGALAQPERRHTAKLMVLAGERITAARAYELGLVQQVVPGGELVPAALRLGARIAARAPLAVQVGKRMINRGIDRGAAGYSVEAVAMLYATRDAAEGIRAFAERREPRFEGR